MQIQVTLDEVLNYLMLRAQSSEALLETLRVRANAVGRALYRKGLLTDEDIRSAVEEEYRIMRELKNIPPDVREEEIRAEIEEVTRSIVNWFRGDVEDIKKALEDYEKAVKEAMARRAARSRLDVAPATVLTQLDRMKGAPGGKKLII